MFKKLLISICLLTSSGLSTNSATIKTVFIDVNALFETNTLKAMKYVDTWDATKYTFKLKHKPSQADLFEKLEKTPAQSTTTTYNENLKMPRVFSDWLMNLESASSLETKMINFLQKSNISDIEKKVLSCIIKMMLNPSALVDTQKTISFVEDLISSLKAKGYKIYIVGNWANSKALKDGFKSLFSKIDGTIFSCDIQQLKPQKDFYLTAMKQANIDKNSCIWIEKESEFIKKAQSFGYKTINADSKKSMLQDLKSININI